MHYIDECGLGDPLLARLPAVKDVNWRIGHFRRQIPVNYVNSIAHGHNALADPQTRHYWDSIRLVTRGPLLSRQGLREIFRLNLGNVEEPDMELYRTPDAPALQQARVLAATDVSNLKEAGTPWNAPGNIVFDGALEIVLPEKKDIRALDVTVDQNDVYEIFALSHEHWVPLMEIQPSPVPGLARHRVEREVVVPAVERIRVLAKHGDGMYALGHFVVEEP